MSLWKLILLALLAAPHIPGLTLRATFDPSKKPGLTEVNLTCLFEAADRHAFYDLVVIRIIKYVTDPRQGQVLAEIHNDNGSILTTEIKTAHVMGHRNGEAIILEVTSDMNNEDSYGRYFCNCIGYDRLNNILDVYSPEIEQKESHTPWPRGSYGIPMPHTGCPANNGGATWKTGWRKHHLERMANYTTKGHHMQKPFFEVEGDSTFIFQHFCIASQFPTGPDWPRGSYCLLMSSQQCPPKFSSGFISWAEKSLSEHSGTLPRGFYGHYYTLINYCCRLDGSPDTPVLLPTSQAFYLYKHGGGGCQQVDGMKVTQESLLFDTRNGRTNWHFGHTPDGSQIPDIRLELCYYQPRRNVSGK